MDTIAIVRKYIIDNFLFEEDAAITPEISFLENGIIDSTGILELATFLEETFHITIQDDEFLPENLDSLNHIEAFISRKTQPDTRPQKESPHPCGTLNPNTLQTEEENDRCAVSRAS